MSNLADDHRRRELAQIHVAKKQLNMDDETYRNVIFTISHSRTRSAGELDYAERQKLLDHMKTCGFKVQAKPTERLFPNTPTWNKVWSLWQKLAEAGKVNDRRATALLNFCQHQTGVDAVKWMTAEHQNAIIEALKSWLAR